MLTGFINHKGFWSFETGQWEEKKWCIPWVICWLLLHFSLVLGNEQESEHVGA